MTSINAKTLKTLFQVGVTYIGNNFEYIDELKKKSADYERILKSKIEDVYKKQVENYVKKNKKEPGSSEQQELRKNSERMAVNDLRENNLILSGAAEQYKMYLDAPQDVKDHLGKPIEINPEKITFSALQLIGSSQYSLSLSALPSPL